MGALGLSGEQGEYFKARNGNQALDQINANNASLQDQGFQNRSNAFSQGVGTSAQAMAGNNQAQNDQFATGSTTGSQYATEQVQNNPILGQLFGKGGELSNSVNKEQDLQNQGFKLTPQDQEAYGQASGNIGRMFGQSENNLAQNLADRGLSAGASGAAGAQFSGLQGNKNEQLAGAQTQIANQRMQNTMERIGQQQKFIGQLSGQANQAIGDQFGRQMQGAQNTQGNLQKSAALQTQDNAQANAAELASQQDKRGAKGHGLMDAFGQGLFSSAAGLGGSFGSVAQAKNNADQGAKKKVSGQTWAGGDDPTAAAGIG